MTASLIIPFSGDCPHRRAAREWLIRRVEALHPELELVLVETFGVWSKPRAVNLGVQRSSCERIIVLDADCVPTVEAMRNAVTGSGWGQPFHIVNRLNRQQTRSVLAGDITTDVFPEGQLGRRAAGGGMIFFDRAMLTELGGWHEGFTGWGAEDNWLAHMMKKRFGPGTLSESVLTHLWHPRDPKRRETAAYRANRAILKAAQNEN